MLTTPHLLAASALATTTSVYPVAFLLGVIAHFILDMIPHVDPGTFHKVERDEWLKCPRWIVAVAAIDFIIAWIIVILLFKNRPEFGLIIVGGLGGIIIDILDNIPIKNLDRQPFFRQLHWIHEKIHFNLNPRYWFWGILTQIIAIGGTIWYCLRFLSS